MSTKIHPVILCGGSGTRLWPRSRAARPKPFLPLVGHKTLFEQTIARNSGSIFAPPTIVAGAAHRELVAEQAGGIEGLRRIEEPAGRNTAPAIALAALLADESQVRNPRHGVMPAWSARLGDTTVKELAVFVHSLGGGQ